jgi:hypothetical protein
MKPSSPLPNDDLEDNAAVLASSTIMATDAQHSGAQRPRSNSNNNRDLSKSSSMLVKTASTIRNVITEAALVSTCPDGFLGAPPRMESLVAAGESTSFEPSEKHLKSDPAVDLFLSRFPLPLDQSPKVQPSDNLVCLCRRLGMHPSAADGWNGMSMKPRAAMFIFFFSLGFFSITLVIHFGVGLLYSSWQPYLGIGAVLFAIVKTAECCLFWRYGPKFARSKPCAVLLILGLGMATIFSCLSYLWPSEGCPFRSLLVNTFMLGTAAFFSNVSGKLGRLPMDHPSQPMLNFRNVFFDATIRTLRIMDSLTDMILVRLLASQVKQHPFVCLIQLCLHHR